SDNTDVWTIPAAGGSLTKISDHAFDDESPRWSPDGKQILFNGQTALHQFAKAYIVDSAGGAASQFAVNGLDMVPGDLHWASANSFLFTGESKGEIQIYRGDLGSRKFSAVTSGPRGVRSMDLNGTSGKMVYLSSDFQHLDDLCIASLDGSGEKQLT